MMKSFPEQPSGPVELHNTTDQVIPVDRTLLENTVKRLENGQFVQFAHLEVVFVDENEIVRINKEYLERDYITDIISFRYDEDQSNEQIEGTLYCCAPRISEQSKELGTSKKEEFLRIIIHGLLHLCGYDDNSEDSKKKMTLLENRYLNDLGFNA